MIFNFKKRTISDGVTVWTLPNDATWKVVDVETGELLSPVFMANTDTGVIMVPRPSVAGGPPDFSKDEMRETHGVIVIPTNEDAMWHAALHPEWYPGLTERAEVIE